MDISDPLIILGYTFISANHSNNGGGLHDKISIEKIYASFYTGDFNGHSQFWWKDGDTTPKGKVIEELFASLNFF